ncbi:hypothetical protein ACA578_13465 [Lactiplantibacillus plantarum]|uniref:hypothetical protein n=1 Tax=Lactiplantibacillus plantarum TaxID=1590 RepID=UPI003C13BC4D
MTEKLVLRKQHLNSNNGTKPIFVDVSILDSIREIKEETGIPMRRIVKQFLCYAMKNVQIVDEEEGNQ